jgi:hypothetical protein
MQRSIFDYTGNVFKNNCRIDFPEYLDIREFSTCTDGLYFKPREMAEASSWKSSLDIKIEEAMSRCSSHDASNNSLPEQNMKESDGIKLDDTFKEYMYLYRLNAVVLHYGSHDSGHFVTYRRFPRKHRTSKGKSLKAEKWYAISDDHVRRITDVQGEVFGYASQFVYLLFYERCRGLSEYHAQVLRNSNDEDTPENLVTQIQSTQHSKKED